MWKYLLIFCVVYLAMILSGHWLFTLIASAKGSKEKILRRAFGENDFNPYLAAEKDAWFGQTETWERISVDSGFRRKLSAYERHRTESGHRWAVCLHDYGTDARHAAGYARWFYQEGYHILLPDARGCGKSDGTLLGLGFADQEDLEKWVNCITKEDPEAEIILFGLGTGGAEALFYCCGKPAEQVKGVIADSSYAGLWEAILPHLIPRLGGLAKVVANFANTEYFLRCGLKNDWRKVDLWRRMKACRLPVLLIHGEEDYLFTVKHFEVLSENLNESSAAFRVPGAGHIAAVYAEPEQYWGAVSRYLESVMT